ALHSFPTRRSSDLVPGRGAGGAQGETGRALGEVFRQRETEAKLDGLSGRRWMAFARTGDTGSAVPACALHACQIRGALGEAPSVAVRQARRDRARAHGQAIVGAARVPVASRRVLRPSFAHRSCAPALAALTVVAMGVR